MIKRIFLSAIALVSCVGCASTKSNTSGVDVAVSQTRDGLGDAALQPLNDLNLKRDSIPHILKNIKTPYDPIIADCDIIAQRVLELDDILGPDVDSIPDHDEGPGLSHQAGESAADYTLDTIRGVTTDVIPFRSLVRRATGATAHDKRIQNAYQRGLRRRAYLKGYGNALGCLPPAAPAPMLWLEDPEIEYRGVTPDEMTNAPLTQPRVFGDE